MTRMIDVNDPATAKLFERVDRGIDSANESERSHPCATNDECEHIETAPLIEIWKPAEPQFCKAIYSYYGVKPRTVQKWAKRILEVCPWFDESEFRLPDDRYTPLCIELMGSYYTSGLDAPRWAKAIEHRFTDRIAAQSATPSPQQDSPQGNGSKTSAVEGPSHRESFISPLEPLKPFTVPTSVEIVPETQPLSVQSLDQANGKLLQGRTDVEAALLLVTQVGQLVQYTVEIDIEQSTLEEQQVSQLEEAAFDLGIHKECLERQQRANNIRRGYRNARRNRAQSQIVKMQGFFAERAGSRAPEASQG